MKWSTFKRVVQATWFWRVYGICAMKRTWTKLLIAISLFSWIMIARTGPDLLTPIIELNQMHRTEGVLLNVGFNPKGHDSLRIKTDDGEKITYLGNTFGGAGIDLVKLVGQRITIWSQQVYEGWPPFVFEGYREVRQGDKVLLKYSLTTRKVLLDFETSEIHFLLYTAILPILVVGWVCRNEIDG